DELREEDPSRPPAPWRVPLPKPERDRGHPALAPRESQDATGGEHPPPRARIPPTAGCHSTPGPGLPVSPSPHPHHLLRQPATVATRLPYPLPLALAEPPSGRPRATLPQASLPLAWRAPQALRPGRLHSPPRAGPRALSPCSPVAGRYLPDRLLAGHPSFLDSRIA
ncbi:hypothetical protein H1C71_031036, partial [Ictidomys tridecemlineatus]